MKNLEPYRRNRNAIKPARIVLLIPDEELAAIDDYGGPAGFPSRNAAIRDLLQKGLAASKAETATRVQA